MSNRRKPHAPLAAAVQIPPAARKPWRVSEIALALAAAQDAGVIPRRKFEAPKLPPGVLPRGAKLALDDSSMGANYGWLNGQTGWCGLGFPGYTYLSELAQRSEYRAPAETIATEMTREWIKFTGADEKKVKELETAFEEFGVQECFRLIAVNDGLFGRSQLYVNIKGQDTPAAKALPLIVDAENKGKTIPAGSLMGFKVIEPIWTTPYAYNSMDPTRPDFYKPEWWYILGARTHASRLLTFVSRPVPDILKPSYNFSGLSLSQLIEPYVVRWLKTVDSVNRMISNYSTSGIMTNMESVLSDGSDGSDLFKRMALYNQMRDNRGIMVMDKASEEFFQFNTPLSGLSELQAQAQEHMAAPTHIPLVKLTGITPNGLNASSDGEIKVFYDFIGAEQPNQFGAHLRTVLKIVQLHLWGKVDDKIGFEWVPLDTPTDAEESAMRKADGDRDVAYVTNAVVSPDEVRTRLKNDPKSGYTFLEGDAPEPLLDEHELGEEGKDADAERGETAAQADHKRQLELERAKPKPAK